MTANQEAFQSILLGMRERFLDELPERCDGFDNLILALEAKPDDSETFNELFRRVHSLKGTGGTFGLPIITSICHLLESFLSETASRNGFDEGFATRALAHVDLLRRVEAPGRVENGDYSAIEAELEVLRLATLQSRKACLIAESSTVMARIYQKALDDLAVQVTLVDNGLAALEHLLREPFDFVIVGRELKELNGIALMAALRAAQGINRDILVILVILVTSNRDGVPAHASFNAILARDQNLVSGLVAAIQPALRG